MTKGKSARVEERQITSVIADINQDKIKSLLKQLEKFEKDVERETDFSVVNHRLELYGYCRQCQKIIAAG